jgi:hypothetical protein
MRTSFPVEHRRRALILDHAGHTFGIRHPWSGSTEDFDRLLEATVDWFARHLLR